MLFMLISPVLIIFSIVMGARSTRIETTRWVRADVRSVIPHVRVRVLRGKLGVGLK